MKKLLLTLLVLVVLLFGISIFAPNYTLNKSKEVQISPTVINSLIEINAFSYQGRDGVDALTLLREKTEVKVSEQGFVTAINGRMAKEDKKEFWAFYVNGKLAPVGAADYVTKTNEKIEWKIDNYN